MLTSSVFKNPQDEKIDFTFHPAPRRDTLVILAHGLTGNKDRPLLVGLADGLCARGWPCMRLSYAGHGASGGSFGDACITKETGDLKAILDGVPDYVRVVYIGHSMGAAVGVATAATDLRIRVLISLAGMVRTEAFYEREFGGLTPGRDCMWEETEHPLSETFASDMKSINNLLPVAATITQPWLLIHGTADDLVPVQDSRDAHEVAVCMKRLIEVDRAGHSFENEIPQVIEGVDQWLKLHLG